MPKKYFVTRHRGAISWAAKSGVKARKIETEHFDTEIVKPGDIVMGTLPVHLAAKVNELGGHYWHLSMEVPVEYRGLELSAEQMSSFGARLEEYRLTGLGIRVSGEADLRPEPDRTGADVHICIASGEALANYIPLAALTWKKVRIYASKGMRNQAAHLKGMVELLAQQRGIAGPDLCEVISLPAREDWQTLARFAAGEAEKLSIEGVSADLNLTGGTKPMSMAFSEGFQTLARRIYCATDVGELQFFDAVPTAPQSLPPNLVDLETYLAAQAWLIQRGTFQGDAVADAFDLRSGLTASLVLSYGALDTEWVAIDHIQFNDRTERPWKGGALRFLHYVASESPAVIRKDKEKKDRVIKPFEPWVRVGFAKKVPRSLSDLLYALQDAGLVTDVGLDKPGQRENSHPTYHTLYFRWTSEASCQYASGGYLEEYVWGCVQALGLPPAHVGANVAVASFDFAKSARSDLEFNELDIAIAWGNRLLALECKAGMQLVNGKDQDIINKLDSIKDNMGGAKGQAWLVTPVEIKEARVLERAKRN